MCTRRFPPYFGPTHSARTNAAQSSILLGDLPEETVWHANLEIARLQDAVNKVRLRRRIISEPSAAPRTFRVWPTVCAVVFPPHYGEGLHSTIACRA